MDTNWFFASKWAQDKYPRIAPGREVPGTGDTGEPYFSRKAAWFAEIMGGLFKEGLKFLDYGCGGGQLCNFISGHLQNFTYYGLEPKGGRPWKEMGSNLPLGELMVQEARRAFGHDSRVQFGFIGDPIETEALTTVDVIIVMGVFCHVLYDEFEWICNKFLPVLGRGGILLFNVPVRDYVGNIGITPRMGSIDLHERIYTLNQLQGYAVKNGLIMQQYDSYNAFGYFSYSK